MSSRYNSKVVKSVVDIQPLIDVKFIYNAVRPLRNTSIRKSNAWNKVVNSHLPHNYNK